MLFSWKDNTDAVCIVACIYTPAHKRWTWASAEAVCVRGLGEDWRVSHFYLGWRFKSQKKRRKWVKLTWGYEVEV